MNLHKSLNGALKIANSLRLTSLAERVQLLVQSMVTAPPPEPTYSAPSSQQTASQYSSPIMPQVGYVCLPHLTFLCLRRLNLFLLDRFMTKWKTMNSLGMFLLFKTTLHLVVPAACLTIIRFLRCLIMHFLTVIIRTSLTFQAFISLFVLSLDHNLRTKRQRALHMWKPPLDHPTLLTRRILRTSRKTQISQRQKHRKTR